MKKEQLTEIGLTEEQITEVFRLNGLAINAVKAELDTKEAEVETLQGQLETANKEIEGFKGLDVEGIKAKADEYKTKYEQAELEAKEKLEKIEFNHELENAIRDSKARNITAVKALLDIENLKNSNNRLEDINKAIESTKEANDYLFESEQARGTGGSLGNGGKGTGKSITKEEFDKLSYKERVELFNKQPEIYKTLKK